MNEYRKTIPLSTTTDYWFVQMGPIPNKPDWHMKLYAKSSYAFPTEVAAHRFANAAAAEHPDRDVKVIYPERDV